MTFPATTCGAVTWTVWPSAGEGAFVSWPATGTVARTRTPREPRSVNAFDIAILPSVAETLRPRAFASSTVIYQPLGSEKCRNLTEPDRLEPVKPRGPP